MKCEMHKQHSTRYFPQKAYKANTIYHKIFRQKEQFTETWTSEKKGIEETLNQKWNKC